MARFLSGQPDVPQNLGQLPIRLIHALPSRRYRKKIYPTTVPTTSAQRPSPFDRLPISIFSFRPYSRINKMDIFYIQTRGESNTTRRCRQRVYIEQGWAHLFCFEAIVTVVITRVLISLSTQQLCGGTRAIGRINRIEPATVGRNRLVVVRSSGLARLCHWPRRSTLCQRAAQ